MRRHLITAAAIAFGCALASVPPAAAATSRGTPPSATSAPVPATPPKVDSADGAGRARTGGATSSADAVDALVVRSWSDCGSGHVLWKRINETWTELGSTPVDIDYHDPLVCKGKVRYDELVASGADVLILSDVAGGSTEFGKPEIKAIKRYAAEGHGVVAIFMTLRYRSLSNHGLKSLLGIDTVMGRRPQSLVPSYALVESDSPVFTGLPDPYVSAGYPFAQVPKDGSWDDDDLAETARYLATTEDRGGAIIINETPEARSVFVSSMPEFQGGVDDKQFVYNAITYVADLGAARPEIGRS